MSKLDQADQFVIPPDVILQPVKEVDPELLKGISCEQEDFLITRPRLRTRSKVLDVGSAELLQLFNKPRTIVEAIIEFSRIREINPEETLTEAFPFLQRLVTSHLLVKADSDEAEEILPSFDIGQTLLGSQIVRNVQILHDTEVYQVEREGGNVSALKIARVAHSTIQKMLEREASILQHLGGHRSPRLLDHGLFEDRAYLIMNWSDGIHVSTFANKLRHLPISESRNKLLKLALSVLEAYAEIHRLDVIHSDVHAKNILVSDSGAITLVDFGHSRLEGPYGALSKSGRGGIEIFFEPEFAAAKLGRRKTPPSTFIGEQYSLASLLYLLFTGKHHLNLSPEKSEAFQQIAESPHLPFSQHGIQPWPEVENVLAKALSKNPLERYDSVSTFLAKLKEVEIAGHSDKPSFSFGNNSEDVGMVERLLDRSSIFNKLFQEGFLKAPTASVTYGASGLAYGLYQIACLRGDSALLSTLR